MDRIKHLATRLTTWWSGTHLGSILKRYSQRNGALLASGLAYSLLFAFFAALWTVVSVFGIIFARNETFRDGLLMLLDTVVPGILSGENAVIDPSVLSSTSTTFTITGLVTLGIFWWQVTGWFGRLRASSQTVMEAEELREAGAGVTVTQVSHPLKARLVDSLAVLVVSVLFTVATLAGAFAPAISGAVRWVLGIEETDWWSGVLSGSIGFVVGLIFNAALLIVLFRLVCQVKDMRSVLYVSGGGAIVLSVLQLLGGRLLSGASNNPLLAPFAAIVAILLWFNIISQVLMLSSAALGEILEAKVRTTGSK